jgi:oxygen-dependent protoporphyrinogen oxidase
VGDRAGRPGARALVIGGGVTGLAAAHRLVELGLEPVLLERESRCGGVVLTEELKGFLIEAGPDSFLARKPWAADLCRRLGLGEEIIPTDPANRGSFVWFGGRLHALPEGLTSLVPTRLGPIARSRLLTPAGKARLLLEPLVPRGPEREDESLAGFFRRRLGDQASRRLVEPLVRGIYGGDAESLSLQATFPQLAEIERRHGSLLVGLLRQAGASPPARSNDDAGAGQGLAAGGAAFLSLRRGMGSLVDRLRQTLPPGSVKTGTGATTLRRIPTASSAPLIAGSRFEESLEVELTTGERLTAGAVILATPPAEAARLVAQVDPDLGSLVGSIRSGSSVTVALGFERDRVRHPLRGHGFVVPETTGGALLACTWASSKFPGRAPAGSVLVRAFLAHPESLLGRDDRAVTATALQALRPILGLEDEPRLARVHRWREALPRYAVGHPTRRAQIERRLASIPGLYLAGAAYRGVGIPDCVRDGEKAADAAHARLAAAATRPLS